jgi:hypothetical protein
MKKKAPAKNNPQPEVRRKREEESHDNPSIFNRKELKET